MIVLAHLMRFVELLQRDGVVLHEEQISKTLIQSHHVSVSMPLTKNVKGASPQSTIFAQSFM